MLRGGQTPSWTCQMVFNPAHCPRSSAPFSSHSLCLLSFSRMFALFFWPPFPHLYLLCFTLTSILSVFLNTSFSFPSLHIAISSPPASLSPLYFLLSSFLTDATWSLLSNTFNFLKHIAPSLSSSITGHTHSSQKHTPCVGSQKNDRPVLTPQTVAHLFHSLQFSHLQSSTDRPIFSSLT